MDMSYCSCKNIHILFSQSKIEEKILKWPSGLHLVMPCTAPNTNVKLVAIGYKCNSRKCVYFVMTHNAAAMAPSLLSYIAKYLDGFGNIKER